MDATRSHSRLLAMLLLMALAGVLLAGPVAQATPAGCTAAGVSKSCSYRSTTGVIEIVATAAFDWQVTFTAGNYEFTCASGTQGAEVATCQVGVKGIVRAQLFDGVVIVRDVPAPICLVGCI